MNHVTLMGAEEVSRAASRISEAATKMSEAASNIDYALHQHRQFLDEWLLRFEAALKEAK